MNSHTRSVLLDDSEHQRERANLAERVFGGSIIEIAGHIARVKAVGERDDGIVHARIRRLDVSHDEIAHRDPTTGAWRLGRASCRPE